MRILDKNTDFYDYFQNVYPDGTLTFDRSDSFLLTKEILCSHLDVQRYYSRFEKVDGLRCNFLLLQICNTFWLFLVKIKDINSFGHVLDYDMELISTWKNYSLKRELCKLDIIEFPYSVVRQCSTSSGYGFTGYDVAKVHEKSHLFMQLIGIKDYKVMRHLNRYIMYHGNGERVDKHIPLLKACGIASCINALDVFLAFEEYFSLEKTDGERRDPIGMTNDDKIESHGFDKKNSFRGKPK